MGRTKIEVMKTKFWLGYGLQLSKRFVPRFTQERDAFVDWDFVRSFSVLLGLAKAFEHNSQDSGKMALLLHRSSTSGYRHKQKIQKKFEGLPISKCCRSACYKINQSKIPANLLKEIIWATDRKAAHYPSPRSLYSSQTSASSVSPALNQQTEHMPFKIA
jgi:hypothetical protein